MLNVFKIDQEVYFLSFETTVERTPSILSKADPPAEELNIGTTRPKYLRGLSCEFVTVRNPFEGDHEKMSTRTNHEQITLALDQMTNNKFHAAIRA